MPSPRRSCALPVCLVALVAVTALVPSLGSESAPPGAGRAMRLMGSAESSIGFSLDLLPLRTLDVALQVQADATMSGGTIAPGASVTASATLTFPGSVDLKITYNGVSTSVPVGSVGTSLEVPVPGLGLSYLGFSLGVLLNFTSAVSAASSVTGAGHGGGGNLTWNSSGSISFPLSADSSAAPGSRVVSTLSGISYSISMGLDAGAVIPVLGNYVVHLLKFGNVGVIPGIPSSIWSSYDVPVPASPTGASTATVSGAVMLGVIGGGAVAGGVIGLVVWRRRRGPRIP